MSTTEETPELLAARRIVDAFYRMPYGGLSFEYPDDSYTNRSQPEWTLEMIATNLERLQESLRQVADDAGVRDRELSELRHEVASVGSFMRRAMNAGEP